jgi:hypothetical protein
MSYQDVRVIGVTRLALSQKRFGKGGFYVSAILNDSDLEAIDCRYFVEDGAGIVPTRSGFRVHSSEFETFKEVLSTLPSQIHEHPIWESTSRKLIVRRCADEFGLGVDFRYFKTSKNYTGWEKRGIRLNDYVHLSKEVLNSGLLEHQVPSLDLFKEKNILTSNERHAVSSNKVITHEPTTWSPVNAALNAFLNEEG